MSSETSIVEQATHDFDLEQEYKKLDFGLLKVPQTIATGNTTAGGQPTNAQQPNVKIASSQFNTNLERFHFICKDLPSDNLFINFDFYFMVASALARRCWLGEGDMYRIYPNLYIVCVSDPGLGKSLPARTVNQILSSLVDTKFDKGQNKVVELKLLNLGPDAITYEKLILRAAAATDSIKLPTGKIYQHASTTFCLGEELGMLFSDNTRKVVSFLMQAYDCHRFEGDTIKHGVKIINNICINFLGCTTPGIIRDLLKTKVLDDGFTGRALFLYTDKKRPHPATIHFKPEQAVEMEHIKKHLRQLAKLVPKQLNYTPEAQKWIDHWHHHKEDIKLNDHPKLKDFHARRRIQMIKLAIAHALADKITDVIDVPNLEAAEKLIASAEVNMHKALIGNSENPLAMLADSIKEYVAKNGPTSRKKLHLQFYAQAHDDISGLQRAMDFLVGTDQCVSTQVDGKDGLAVVKQQQ